MQGASRRGLQCRAPPRLLLQLSFFSEIPGFPPSFARGGGHGGGDHFRDNHFSSGIRDTSHDRYGGYGNRAGGLSGGLRGYGGRDVWGHWGAYYGPMILPFELGRPRQIVLQQRTPPIRWAIAASFIFSAVAFSVTPGAAKAGPIVPPGHTCLEYNKRRNGLRLYELCAMRGDGFRHRRRVLWSELL